MQTFEVALSEDRISAHTVRAQAEIACGRADSVITELEELVARYPYREPLWAQLMTAYYLAQRQSDALDAFRRVKAVLAAGRGAHRCSAPKRYPVVSRLPAVASSPASPAG